MIRGNCDKAEFGFRRLLSRGARVQGRFNAAVSNAPYFRSGRSKVVQIKVFGLDSDALFVCCTIPNLISKRLCEKQSLRFEEKLIGLTVADGQRARSIGTITGFSVSFENLHTSMDFYVMKDPPFDVIIGFPALKALRGCLEFGLQQVTLFAGDIKAVLNFRYAVVEVPVIDNAKEDSEDFTSKSVAETNEDANVEDEFIVALSDNIGKDQDSIVEFYLSVDKQRDLLL